MVIVAKCIHGLSPITGLNDHWWDDTHAECSKCKQVFSHTNFHKSGKAGKRPVHHRCKPCTAEIAFERRRKDIKEYKYKRYKSIMRNEGNDCDLTQEEFIDTYWPKDNKCPILGHELKLFPKEERGKWSGGRHYPFTPCVDHIDPRKPMSKNNLQIICWRANELKSDAIPEEIHLLSIHMNNILPIGKDVLDVITYKHDLERSEWVGK